jgi:hypothetical protein
VKTAVLLAYYKPTLKSHGHVSKNLIVVNIFATNHIVHVNLEMKYHPIKAGLLTHCRAISYKGDGRPILHIIGILSARIWVKLPATHIC